MTDFPVLNTDRLLLRKILLEDAPDLLVIHSNVDAMRWFGSEPIKDLHGAKHLIGVFDNWRKQPISGIRWGIERELDKKFLGTCGFFKWNRNWNSCTLGYELGKYAWGKGYMQESLSAILGWGFSNMKLNRIEAQIHPMNTASIKLVKKLGFVQEGILRQAGFWNGQYHDMLQFSLLCGDFKH